MPRKTNRKGRATSRPNVPRNDAQTPAFTPRQARMPTTLNPRNMRGKTPPKGLVPGKGGHR